MIHYSHCILVNRIEQQAGVDWRAVASGLVNYVN